MPDVDAMGEIGEMMRAVATEAVRNAIVIEEVLVYIEQLKQLPPHDLICIGEVTATMTRICQRYLGTLKRGEGRGTYEVPF